MISAIYDCDDSQRYNYLEVSGHAESDDYGKDLICAGVSSIIFGFMNALDAQNDDVVIEQEENHIRIINNSKSETIQNYFELILIQLKTIEVSYEEFLKVERKNNI